MLDVVDSIDQKKWSEFVSNHPQGNIFQTPEMAEVYRRTENYTPLFLALQDADEIYGLLLASLIQEKSILSHFSSRSIITGGPLLSKDLGQKGTIQFLQEYNRIVSGRTLFTHIRPLSDSFNGERYFIDSGFQREERLNFLIDLNRSERELWRSIPKSRRKNIKRAEKKGVEVHEMKSKSQLPVFYDLIKETYKRVKIPVADISLFGAAFDILVPKKMARFYLAIYEGESIASRVVLNYNGLTYDWYAGTSGEHMKLYANEAIVWRVLQDSREDGFHTFNFGGAGKPGEKAGRYVFKKRFGGQEVRQGRYIKVHSLLKMKVAETGYKICRKLGRINV